MAVGPFVHLFSGVYLNRSIESGEDKSGHISEFFEFIFLIRKLEMDSSHPRTILFSTKLGWIALSHSDGKIVRTKVGYGSELLAAKAINEEVADANFVVQLNEEERQMRKDFKAYAGGQKMDFKHLRLDLGDQTDFSREVLKHCRRVGYGQTITYGQLAEKAGSPRGARAVGSCMRKNRFPLVIPCHRIVAGSGIGGFSGPRGCELKQKLLELEGVTAFKAKA